MSSFAFGKHKGKSFQEVASSDPGYCQWALKQDSPSGALKNFVEFLKLSGGKGANAASNSEFPNHTGRPDWLKAADGALAPSPRSNAPPRRPLPTANPSAPTVVLNGPRLEDNITLVMALVDDDRFTVRPERHAGVSFNTSSLRPTSFTGKLSDQHRTSATPYLPPHIYSAIKEIKDCQVGADRSLSFPLRRLEAVQDCLEQIGKIESIPPWVLQVCRATGSGKRDCLMEDRLPGKLFPYQVDGVRYGLDHCGRCLIGDEMGLGKTLQALALAAQYAEEWPVLVLCPTSLRWVWKEQICEWLPQFVEEADIQVVKKGSDALNPDARFWIVSYAMFTSNAKTEHKSLQQRPDGSDHAIIIVDESHNIKEWSAARTKVTVPILKKAKRLFLLSGTPTRNSPEELHPQLSALFPRTFIKMAEFRSRYCTQQQMMVGGGRIVQQVTGARNSTELNYVLAKTVMVRRLKKDVLHELPPKRRQKVPLDCADARQMKEIKNHSYHLLEDDHGEAKMAIFKKMAEIKLPAVKEHVLEVLDRGDEKAIIFAHHKIMMDALSGLLEKRLAQDRVHHIRIDGSTPPSKRADLVKDFQTNPGCRIALLSVTACGEGITLTAAGLVIFAELPFVPGAVEQAEARAHRIGTTHNKVVVEFLVLPDSLDERVFNNLERKKKDTSKCLDGAEESLGVESALESLSRKRARDLAEERGMATLHFPQSKKRSTDSTAAGKNAGVLINLKEEALKASRVDSVSEPSVEKSPAPKKSGQACAQVASDKSPQLSTPPPVSRQKVEMLLRAAKG